MKEQLISFDTAKLAKEKGFDEWTFEAFTLEGKNSDISYHPQRRAKKKLYPSPTQSLLQKWLREKHNVYVIVLQAEEGQEYFEILFTNKKAINIRSYIVTSTSIYEEALEIGLQEALKLIK